MTNEQHTQVSIFGIDCLPDEAGKYWAEYRDLFADAANFTDIFWPGDEASLAYREKYPDWRDYIMVPVDGKMVNCHSSFDPVELFRTYPPVIAFYVSRALAEMKKGNVEKAAKYAGVFSHVIGDTGQLAHAIDPRVIVPLVQRSGECYLLHTQLENIPGVHAFAHDHQVICLGRTSGQLQWGLLQRLARQKRRTLLNLLPTINACESGDLSKAQQLASLVMNDCADLFGDFLYSLWCLKNGKIAEAPRTFDLRECEYSDCCCDGMFNHLPQIDAIPGPNRHSPEILDFGNGPEKGIALLPWLYPGYEGVRRAYVEYPLPVVTFVKLKFVCGLNRAAPKNETDAIFEVWVDGVLIWHSPALSADSVPLAVELTRISGKKLRLAVRDARQAADSAPTRFFYPFFACPELTFTD